MDTSWDAEGPNASPFGNVPADNTVNITSELADMRSVMIILMDSLKELKDQVGQLTARPVAPQLTPIARVNVQPIDITLPPTSDSVRRNLFELSSHTLDSDRVSVPSSKLPLVILNGRAGRGEKPNLKEREKWGKRLDKTMPTFREKESGNMPTAIEWVRRMDEYQYYALDNDLKTDIICARRFIEGAAQKFLVPYEHNALCITTWDQFLISFLAGHGDHNSRSNAHRKLLDIRQTGTVNQYALDFISLACDANVTAQYEITRLFLRGLKTQVRTAMMPHNDSFTYDQVKELAFDAERKIDDIRRDSDHSRNRDDSNNHNHINNHQNASRRNTQGKQEKRQAYGSTSTSTTTTTEVKKPSNDKKNQEKKPHSKLTQAEKDERRAAHLCVFCGKHSETIECPILARRNSAHQSVNAVTKQDKLQVKGTIYTKDGKTKAVQILLDPGSVVNLVRRDVATALGIEISDHPKPYTTSAYNRVVLDDIDEIVYALGIAINDHHSFDNCDVVSVSQYDVLLGDEYLRKHSASLCYNSDSIIQFPSESCKKNCVSATTTQSTSDASAAKPKARQNKKR